MRQSKRGAHVRDESGGECCERRRVYLDRAEGVSGSNRERESGVEDDLRDEFEIGSEEGEIFGVILTEWESEREIREREREIFELTGNREQDGGN